MSLNFQTNIEFALSLRLAIAIMEVGWGLS
jgi:hypothetical protein